MGKQLLKWQRRKNMRLHATHLTYDDTVPRYCVLHGNKKTIIIIILITVIICIFDAVCTVHYLTICI